jgi:hypothetical protein
MTFAFRIGIFRFFRAARFINTYPTPLRSTVARSLPGAVDAGGLSNLSAS